MPMALPLVPLPVLEAARPPKVLSALLRCRRLAAAPAAALALVLATLLALVPAPAVVAEAAPVAVISPALVLATLLAQVPAICRTEAVGTRSPFGDE